MNRPWLSTVLLGCALAAGCNNDRAADTQVPATQNSEAVVPSDAPPAPPAQAPEAGIPAGAPQGGAATQLQRPGTRTSPATAAQRQAQEPVREPSRLPAAPPAAESRREPAAPPEPRWREVTVAAGTSLPLELTTALSSETAAVETPVQARLRQPVVVDGTTVLPAGTVLRGNVTDVARAGRVQGRARLTFAFTEATVDGTRETLRTAPLTFQAEATKGEDAAKIGGGAGVGAVIGGIVGGGSGAAKGAAIGGAAGTGAVLATRGKEVELASGADITATLASPLTVRVER